MNDESVTTQQSNIHEESSSNIWSRLGSEKQETSDNYIEEIQQHSQKVSAGMKRRVS